MKNILLICTLLIFSAHLSAKTDKYRLTLRDNPSNSMVIAWNQVSGNEPVVYYGTTDQKQNWSKYAMSAKPDREVDYAEMNNNFVRLHHLTPNTAYYFVIKDSEGLSERFWFKTTPWDTSERISLIAGGDSRSNPEARRNANLMVSKLRPHAILFGGDMTVSGEPHEWQEWLNDWQLTISPDGRMYPVVAARGNHEKNNEMIVNIFDVPNKSVYYAITIGNNLMRTYVLNTEISIAGNQTTWLKEDLALNRDKQVWRIAQYHKPMRPHVASKREGDGQYAEWAQLFYAEKVQLVVECDAHTVKSTWPIRPSTGSKSEEGFERHKNGTVYVGEGCWGAPIRPNDDAKSWTRDHGSFNQFKWIFVDNKSMELRTIKVDNANEVGYVPNDDPFLIPENIDIWSPKNGAVVKIKK